MDVIKINIDKLNKIKENMILYDGLSRFKRIIKIKQFIKSSINKKYVNGRKK